MASIIGLSRVAARAPAPAAAPPLAPPVSALGRLRLALLRSLRRRTALRELRSLDARLRRDIGVGHGGVDEFVAASLRAWSEHAALPSTRRRPGRDSCAAPSRPVIPGW